MSNKRQRTAESLCITDLPDGLLVGISSYLAKPSAALFVIALNQEETQTSNTIISATNWEVLDFSNIEKSLAAKLSDVSIDKILRSIDAANNLKILKLAGCVNITGSGLDVLRSSVVLEQIDMSLVGKNEVPLIEPEPLLSEDVVIPILDGIISRGNSLKQLELPKKWRNIASTQLEQFLERYDQYLRNQRYCCSKCDGLCVGTGDVWVHRERDEWYGSQNNTCSGCLNHFCYRLSCDAANGNSSVDWCKKCEKGYCKSCTATYRCRSCDEEFCNDCMEMKICEGDCETVFCDDCSSEENTCSFCGKMRCHICASIVAGCISSNCNKKVCSECSREMGLNEESKCECGERLEEYGW